MTHEVGRFKAYTDDGTEYTIIEYATTRIEGGMWPAEKVQDRMRELRTTEGYSVNPIAEGVYEVILPWGAVTVRIEDGTAGNSAQ